MLSAFLHEQLLEAQPEVLQEHLTIYIKCYALSLKEIAYRFSFAIPNPWVEVCVPDPDASILELAHTNF